MTTEQLFKKQNLIIIGKWLLKLIVIALLLFALLNWQFFAARVKQGVRSPDEVITSIPEDRQQLIEQDTLVVPSLEIIAPIKFVAEAKESIFQEALQNGVVLYPGTAPVGEQGNTYIFGHSSDFALAKGDYKTVFASLPQIKIGAQILASNGKGEVYEYQVTEKFVAESTDTYLLDQNTEGGTILTLQTSYPIGTALKRYIVRAELVANNPDK